MSKFRLQATCQISVITASEEKHSNEMPFEGVLVRLDEPSTKAPNGSRGHKIQIPSKVAEENLKTLIGMGINYSPDLDKHQPTHKVGVIKRAWIDGKDLKVSGVIWKKDFPEAVKDLNKSSLGMSFEADQIEVKDQDAPVWMISHLCFTGATILYKNAAAYYRTSAEALAAAASMSAMVTNKTSDGGMKMPKPVDKKKKIAASSDDLKSVVNGLKDLTAAVSAQNDAIRELVASKDEDETDPLKARKMKSADMQDDKLDAKGKKKKASSSSSSSSEEDDKDDDEDDDDVDAGSDDEDELEDMNDDDDDDDDDDESEDPGHVNKHANKDEKGDKTTVSNKRAKNKDVKASADITALLARVESLEASQDELKEENDKLKKRLRFQKTQLAAAAEHTDRKTVAVLSPLLANALAKGGIDVSSIAASGTKVTVSEIDQIFANSGITGTTAMAGKNEMVRAGILEDGAVVRQ